MAPKSNVPIRIGGSKVRTGCVSCKRRHLKCGEERPICARCRRANLECTYQDLTTQTNPALLSHGPSPYGSRDGAEVQAVQSFVYTLGPELAGLFSNQIWVRDLPRTAQNEPIIWDALVSINMLSESIRLGQDSRPAIRQYAKGVRGLNERLQMSQGDSRSTRDVILISTVLFAIFECLQDCILNALNHTRGGMRLLSEWSSDEATSNGAYVDRKSLMPVFLCFDSHAIQYGGLNTPEVSHVVSMESPISHEFTSIAEASEALNLIFHRLSIWVKDLEAGIDSGTGDCQRRVRKELGEWDSAFSRLAGESNHSPVLLLRCQRAALEAFYNGHSDPSSEMAWDDCLPSFRECLLYAEAYMQSIAHETTSSHPPRPKFTASTDIVMPLFLICTKCRDSATRRRALAALKTCRRREGIWDSAGCAALCEQIIEAEEASVGDDGLIDENARIREIQVQMDEEKVTEVVCRTREAEHHLETLYTEGG